MMKKSMLFLFSVVLFSCSSAVEEKKEEVKSDSVVTTESIPVSGDYYYEITNKETGEKIEISQKEYINSDYLENPEYTVEEKVHVN